MNGDVVVKSNVWIASRLIWIAWLVIAGIMAILFFDALSYMVYIWNKQEEYGHGFLIPIIVGFFIWQKTPELEKIEFTGTWKGVLIVLPGLALYLAGELATLYVVIQYAFVIILLGLIYSFTGHQAFKKIVAPLFLFFLMIPLPDFLYQNLSAQLQLLSTQIGVTVIRLMDISVYVEGNVIDLGTYKLQVVDACSGLRYLFPLMTLGLIAAYIFQQSIWKKTLLFLSTIPITILMNSFRIGVIGVMVEYWGQDMAEGFLHDFQGWVVFMSCLAILIVEMWVLSRIGKDKMPLLDAFGLDLPQASPKKSDGKQRYLPKPFILACSIIIVSAVAVQLFPKSEEIIPERVSFDHFPLKVGSWEGRSKSMESIYIDALKFTDYIMVDYLSDQNMNINFYSAFYNSQKKGASAHSPRSCIPGGGWKITSHKVVQVEGVSIGSQPLWVNRLIIEKDETKQLVYYWFQQRGRIVTSEYAMKWYLLWDSISQDRTDGALMRLTTVVGRYDKLEKADENLRKFLGEIAPIVPEYVPN